MDTARIAELLAPFLASSLAESQLQNILIYINILLRWNKKLNLTAIRNPEEMVTRHFGESLFAAEHLFRRLSDIGPPAAGVGREAAVRPSELSSTTRVIDVGSGAGFPGIPLKLWAPEIQLSLIESNHKKATFLREVIRTLTLTHIDVFTGRAEDFPAASADLVTLRAVERLESVLPIAARLVVPAGRGALLIGQAQAARVPELVSDFAWRGPVSIPLSFARVLLIGTRNLG